ncbi:hypothetical protein GQ457_07G024000 [Hibiscus cannabinus]
MTANGAKNVRNISQQSSLTQCCMCGDSGFTHELLQCKLCHFRSQHRSFYFPPKSRYCSNLYPKAESYEVCNWCLSQKLDSKSQNSSTCSPSCKENSVDDGKKKRKGDCNDGGGQRNKNLKQQSVNRPESPEKRPPCTARKRIISNARLEEKLRARKSKEGGGHITRHVFRNKVQRYKLLDEVSS